MQVFIHNEERHFLALASDHRVARINPTNLLSRYVNGLISEVSMLNLPSDRIVVEVAPLDASEIRRLKRRIGQAKPDSRQGARIAGDIRQAGRAAIEAEIRDARLTDRAPDPRVSMHAMDAAKDALDPAQRKQLAQHRAHRTAIVEGICNASIVSIRLTPEDANLREQLETAGHPLAAEFKPGQYPSLKVATKVLTPSLHAEAQMLRGDNEEPLRAAGDAFTKSVEALAGIEFADALCSLAELAASAFAMELQMGGLVIDADDDAVQTLISDRIAQPLQELRTGLLADADDAVQEKAEVLLRAALRRALAQHRATYRGSTEGEELLVEIANHIERLAKVGKALST